MSAGERHPQGTASRVWRFSLPCLVVAAAAAVVAGLVEGVVFLGSPLPVAAAAGFSGFYAAPFGFVLFVVGRLLWRAWSPEQLREATREEGGGAPILAAWVLYVGLCLAILALVSSVAVELGGRTFRRTTIVGLATSIAVVGTAALLIVLSRPSARGLAALLRWIDRRVRGAAGRRSLFTPWRVLAMGVAGVALYLVGTWFWSVKPRVGHLALDAGVYALAFALAAVLARLAWGRLGDRARRRAALGTAGAWLLVVGAAAVMRYQRPFAMLDLWAQAPVAGTAVYETFDFDRIRAEFRLGEIRPAEQSGVAHPDVILLTIDTVRADQTPPYGGPAKMPGLEALSKRGVVFDWAFSPGNTTRRSLPTLATGVSARRIHGRVAGWALRLDPRHVTLAERFRAAGYDTAGFFCCYSHWGPKHRLGLNHGIDTLVIDGNGKKLVGKAMAWLEQRRQAGPKRPLFLWIHVFEPHTWDQVYPASKFGKPIQPRYDRLLGDTDAFMRPLFELLSTGDAVGHTVLVVTADHGEGMGDHGAPAHSTDLYDSQIHVPLVVLAPGIQPGRIGMPVSLTDLPPTMLDLAGFVPPRLPVMDGHSLAPYLRGEKIPRREDGIAYSSMIADRSVPDSLDALILGRHKLIVGPGKRVQLYDISTDPGEHHDLSRTHRALVAEMRTALLAREALNGISPFVSF